MQDRCHYAKQTEAVASMGLKSGPKERRLTEEEFVKREQQGESVAGPCAGFMRAGVGVGAGASGGRCRSSGPADAAITCIVYAKGSA